MSYLLHCFEVSLSEGWPQKVGLGGGGGGLIHRQVLIKIASRLMKMYMCAAVHSGKACAACTLMALDVWLELRPGIDPKTLQEFKLC